MSVLVKVPQLESPPVQGSARFQALVDDVDVQYGDLLYFCEDHWLSRGAMLSRVCDLQKEIATFLRQNNLPYADQFFNPRWLARLDLLTDITTHLSALNVKLQGKDILITDMHAHITACDVGKPGIVEAQLANGQLEHFPRLAACVPDDVEPDTFVSVSPLWGRNLHPFSQESGRWLRTSSCLPPPLNFLWTTPMLLTDVVGGATVQWWTEGEVRQLFSTVLLPRLRPPFYEFS